MADDLINNFRDENFGDEEGPDWVQDLEFGSESATASDPGLAGEPGDFDEFEELRQRSARAGTVYEEVDFEEDASSKGSAFSLNQFTPGQRMVLAILVLLNVIVGGVAILALTGVIG